MANFFSVLVVALVFMSCGSVSANSPIVDETILAQKKPGPRLKKIGDLKPTFYWVAVEQRDSAQNNKSLLDMDGNELARVTEKFYNEIRLEGTGKMLDGRIINYAGRVELPNGKKEIRYLVCPPEAPYGYGFEKRILVPFKSVAVDPTVVPLGSKVYIPKAVGMRLPDGSTHNGIFEAIDIGDAIKNKRIDMFTAFGDQSIVFRRAGIENMKAMEVFLME